MNEALQIVIFLITIMGCGVSLFTRNVLHATYALAVCLVGVAGAYVLLSAEFLAVVQLLIYAGGVVILLSFGVMITQRRKGNKMLDTPTNRGVALCISISIFLILSYLIYSHDFGRGAKGVVVVEASVKRIGASFLTEHLVAFELIAFILLVALVGSSYLASTSGDD